MDSYEKLLAEIQNDTIIDENSNLPDDILGYYVGTKTDNLILLNKNIKCKKEKTCILAEELGHYHTSTGNILDQSKAENRKQEKKARKWGYEKLIPLRSLINAYKHGCRNSYEAADFLDVTEEFLLKTIQHYFYKYGKSYLFDKRYIIYFEPLAIYERFND